VALRGRGWIGRPEWVVDQVGFVDQLSCRRNSSGQGWVAGMPGRPSKRDQILRVAAKLFAEKGASQVTMDEIASAVPVSKMTIYNHFRTKDRLIDEVIRQAFQRGVSKFCSLIQDAPSFEQAIERISSYDFANLEGFSHVFLLDLTKSYPEKAVNLVDAYKREVEPRVEELICNAQRAGSVRQDISPHIIVMLIRCIKECLSRPDAFGGVEDMEVASKQVIEVLLRGVLAEPESDGASDP
jgi:AcrR family transcriptional regulator